MGNHPVMGQQRSVKGTGEEGYRRYRPLGLELFCGGGVDLVAPSDTLNAGVPGDPRQLKQA